MNQNWITAFEALKSVYTEDAYSNIAINEAISHHNGCRDSFVRTLVKGTIRDTIRLDSIIDGLASGGVRSIKKRTLIIIRMGLYALRSMDSVPDHAAVDESVKLARKTAKGTERFVNAILRNYLRNRSDIENEPVGLALRYSFPEELVSLISSQYGEETENILKGLSTAPKVSVRVNTLRTDPDELISLLGKHGIRAVKAHEEGVCGEDVPVLITEGSGLIGTPMFRDGLFTVQSISSAKAIAALKSVSEGGLKPGDEVLDMCAAPGGKATMMAELMENKGRITACDIHEHRLGLIQASADRLGIGIVETKLLDGTIHDDALDNRFDCVLADVPCSGLGVIASKPEIKLRTSTDSYEELCRVQTEILTNAVQYARPGGLIEYSTCTLNKNENERVVEAVLKECSFISIIEMHTVLPYNNLVGFFYCILRKNASE